MKSIGVTLLLPAASLVAATYPTGEQLLKFYEKSDCSGTGSESTISMLLPSVNGDCESGTAELMWPTVSAGTSEQIAYVDATGIPSGCSVAMLQQANIQPGACGSVIDVITSGTGTDCLQTKLPQKGGVAMCCGGTGAGCSIIPQPGKRALSSAARRRNATVARDVTKIKRAPILERLQKRDCPFTNTNGPFESRGSQQIVSDGVSCPAGSSSPCSITKSTSVTKGSSNSFGATESTTVGADVLFASVQETVSFSYDYTYSSSTTDTTSYTVNVPAGENGYITFTPTVSCTSGTFPSSCGLPQESGVACIPLPATGAPQGVFAFVQEQ